MERHIDEIDVKGEHKEIVNFFYRIELKAFVQILLHQHSKLI